MKFGVRSLRKQKKYFLALSIVSALTLSAAGIVRLGGRIWADTAGMTKIQFSDALFCQRVSQAVNDVLGDGMADGSDCANRNLYVSSAEIGNIRTLNITPPEGGFGNIDWETNSISINGEWTTAFYNLTSLSITNMHVQYVTALGSIRGELTYLDLSSNKISDIKPLGRLSNSLTYLDLSNNSTGNELSELSKFTKLTTLKLANTWLSTPDALFQPPEVEYDDETGEPLTEPETSSKLAKVLQTLDISRNESVSSEIEEKTGTCSDNLWSFENFAEDLALTELHAEKDNLNSDDLVCIAKLKHLEKLNVSNNHIDDFSQIKDKAYTSLKIDSQLITRAVESLDYSPLPAIFTQVQEENYFSKIASAPNEAVSLGELGMDNAQFNGDKIRFANVTIASATDENPRPATVTIPAGTGVFENSKLQVYFAGQVVTFNDSNLCNEVYRQGNTREAFYDVGGKYVGPDDSSVVLTNACNAEKKQIAMVNGGSDYFVRLMLDSIDNGAKVDLTGLKDFNSLQVLSLQNDGLDDLDIIAEMQYLEQLWLNDNDLENDDWSIITDALTNLSILYLNNNSMNEIPAEVANLYRLANLYLVNNGISNIDPLAYVSSLTVLDLSENGLITDFSGLVQEDSACNPSLLKIENAGVTGIPSSDIIERGFSNLTSLNLNGNKITSDTIGNLAKAAKLDELYLNENQLSTTSGFSGIANLKKLFLDNNQITDVRGLTALSKLAELHLNNNQISDITGLNTLPALATLDLKNQKLTGAIEESEGSYTLPAVFSQATSLSFPKVSGFRSAGNYTATNGTVNYSRMTATITDIEEEMTVTIPDGGLAGTIITITYDDNDTEEFSGTIVDRTGGSVTIAPTSANSFTVTSDKACVVLWTQDNETTWNRANPSVVSGDSNTRAFTIDQANGAKVIVAYAGDVNGDNDINVRDARKIVNSIIGRDSLSNLEAVLADVDGKNSINIRDARAIINNIMGKAEINW